MKLYGKNPVFERLRANPESVKHIYIQEGFEESGYVYKKAKLRGISVVVVPKSKIMKLTRNTNAQGIIADVDDFSYVEFNELLSHVLEKKQCVLFIDGLNDPQNLGAIIRTAGSLGGFAIVLSTHDCVGVTEAVLRVASGADNYVPVARVANLVNALRKAKEAGFTIAGTVVENGQSIEDTILPYPLGLVIGSERKGIREITRKQLDLELTIPMRIHTLSLNVAQATTIFCYEIKRQKNKK